MWACTSICCRNQLYIDYVRCIKAFFGTYNQSQVSSASWGNFGECMRDYIFNSSKVVGCCGRTGERIARILLPNCPRKTIEKILCEVTGMGKGPVALTTNFKSTSFRIQCSHSFDLSRILVIKNGSIICFPYTAVLFIKFYEFVHNNLASLCSRKTRLSRMIFLINYILIGGKHCSEAIHNYFFSNSFAYIHMTFMVIILRHTFVALKQFRDKSLANTFYWSPRLM